MAWIDAFFIAYNTVQIAGVALPQRPTLNFVSGATGVDNPLNNSTDITVSGGGGGVTPGTAGQIFITKTGPVTSWGILGGDVSPTLSGTTIDLEVVGLLNNPLPSLTTGFLNWTGTGWALSSISAGSFAPGADLLGGGTSTASAQFVSSLSYNLNGYNHTGGGGGDITVNGVNTTLDWVDAPIGILHGGSVYINIGGLSTDHVALGPSSAGIGSGYLRFTASTAVWMVAGTSNILQIN